MDNLVLSKLGHTWIFDIDGTLVKHNGYKLDGYDTILPGVKDFFDTNIREDDYVLLLTSRDEKYINNTASFLINNGIRFNKIVYGLPYGERILVNDRKPSGLKTAFSINVDRDAFYVGSVELDEEI